MSLKFKVGKREFTKSSFSENKGIDPNCVGVCFEDNKVFVADSKDTSKTLEFTRAEWKAFVRGIKAGELSE